LFLFGQDFVQSVKKIIKIIFPVSRLWFRGGWLIVEGMEIVGVFVLICTQDL
jgi:hypothetical protein